MAVDELLMVVDGSGVVVQWSRQAEELVGFTAEKVVGQPVAHLLTRIAAGVRSDARPGRSGVLLLSGVGGRVVGNLRVRPMQCRDGTVGWAVFRAARGAAAIADVQAAAAEAWFAHAPVGLYVLDTQLRIVSAGLATQIMGGVPAERVLGRRLTDVYSFAAPSQIEAMLREVLDSGVPAPERAVRLSLRDGPGRAYWAGVWAFRLEDQHGAFLGVAAALADLSEGEKMRSRWGIITKLRAQMGRTSDVMAACQDLADVLVPFFADIAVVEVVDSVFRGEDPPLAPLGREVPLRRTAFSHSGEPTLQAYPVGNLRTLPFPSPYAQALADLKPRVVDVGPDSPWLSADPASAEAIRVSGVRALITMPLALRGAVLGLLSLVKLAAGSVLAFYTPSILPAAPPGGRGDQDPLGRVLADPQRPLQDLCDDVIYSLPDRPCPGGAVLVLARTRTFPPGQAGTWRFGPDPEEAGRARTRVRRKLAAWKVGEETAQSTELIVSELVTNAIRYGTPPMWLRIIKDLSISCEVHDGSSVFPHLHHPGTLDEFGRGLGIVGRLVQAWGTRYAPDGKTVWTEQALPPNPRALCQP